MRVADAAEIGDNDLADSKSAESASQSRTWEACSTPSIARARTAVFPGYWRARGHGRDLSLPREPVRRHDRRGAARARPGTGPKLRRARRRRRSSGRALKPETYVIVGGGLAGAMAGVVLRDEGFSGRVVLIGGEDHPPYERPPLSKEYLRGEVPVENAYVRPPTFYDETSRLGLAPAPHCRASERVVDLEDGERVPYDKLLIATGARNRPLPVAGVDLEGVFDLRTIEDADRIRARPSPGGRRSSSAWASSARRSRPRSGSSGSRSLSSARECALAARPWRGRGRSAS